MKMMKRAEIREYKGICECEFEGLSRVNLLIGKNDSGKSSIMEAVFHTLKEFLAPNLNTVMSRRTNVFTGGRELWFRYDTKSEIGVSLIFGDFGLRMEARTAGAYINTKLSCLRKSTARGMAKVTEFDGASYIGRTVSTTITTGPGRRPIDRLRGLSQGQVDELSRYAEDAVLIDCGNKSNISALESRLGQIKISGREDEFGLILEDVYRKGKHWEFLPHPDAPDEKRLAIREDGKLVFLSDLGDGFRLGSSIVATAMTAERTGIFIEEIESHQHSGSLRQLVPALVSISRKNDLQLFITTHSLATYNQFARGKAFKRKEDIEREFRCFIVERDIASGKVTAEQTDNIQRIVETLGKP